MAEGRYCEATRVQFGLFELDVRAGELRKAGARVRLARQPMQVLQLLVLRPGQVVTREEIRQALWPADSPVDFEHNLNTAMRRLRAALHDSADAPRFIETLPRRGYRFVARITPMVDSASAVSPGESAPQGVPVAASRTREMFRVATAAVVLIACAGIATWLWWPRPPTPEPGAIRSIAVIPFQSLSDDPELGHFADAMTDRLITSLAQIGTLKVTSRTSVLRYERTPRRIPDIARELQVDAIVEGSVLRVNDTVRITAQLIHGPTDRHLWANSYDGPVNDALALQSRVAQTIANEILGWQRSAKADITTEFVPIDSRARSR